MMIQSRRCVAFHEQATAHSNSTGAEYNDEKVGFPFSFLIFFSWVFLVLHLLYLFVPTRRDCKDTSPS